MATLGAFAEIVGVRRVAIGRTGFGQRLRQVLAALGRHLVPHERYRPERYYMRGPGPKTRAKTRAEAARAAEAEAERG